MDGLHFYVLFSADAEQLDKPFEESEIFNVVKILKGIKFQDQMGFL